MWLKRFWWALVSLCFCLLLLIPVAADDTSGGEEQQLLRVGYVREAAYFYKNDQGEYRGYVPELLHTVAMYGNFKLEMVEFPNYTEEDQALADGKIDIETTVPRTTEWESRFAFSDTPTAHVILSLAVNENNDTYEYGDIQATGNMVIAMIADDASAAHFLDWCAKNNLHPHLRSYTDTDTATQALQQNEVDGLVVNNEVAPGCRMLFHFADVPCFAMFNKNNTDLKIRFESAMSQLLITHPMYEQQLYYEYIVPNATSKSSLTRIEKDYLRTHPTLTIAVQEFSPPYTYVDDNNQLQGALPEYYEKLAQEMGVTFTYQRYATAAEAENAVLQGQADMLGIYTGSLQNAYQNGLRLAEITNDQDIVKISKFKNAAAAGTAAILNRDASLIKEKATADGYVLTTFNTIDDCYDALQNGMVGSIICGASTASWLFNNHRMDGYSREPLYFNNHIYMAVTTNNSTLYKILNKDAKIVNPQFKNMVATQVLPQESLMTFLDRLPLWGLVTVTLIMMAAVILLIALIFMLRRHYKERSLLTAQETENEKEKIRLESLEKSAEEKTMFFSNISHDMRTPLNAIIGYTRLVEKKAISDDVRKDLAKIHQSGHLLLDLINDTLLVSKISSGKLILQEEPMETGEASRVLTADIRTMAEAKGILFIKDTSLMRPRTVIADKLKLQKILLNLLTNAVKFTPAGKHVWFTITDDPVGAPNADFVFTIRDEGIGMSEAYQQQLYTPFAQENRDGYESQGTGLGLSIVKQLVDMLGGIITVNSKINEGTTFTVRLHFREITADAAGSEQSDHLEEPLHQLKGKHLLLCEDNQLNADLAMEILKTKGITIDWAKNGKEGVTMFQDAASGTYAAILMDLRMPLLNGFETTKQIRQLDRDDAKTIPIIAMTADAFAEDIKKCLDVGMNDHIAKPIDPQILFSTLAKYIR